MTSQSSPQPQDAQDRFLKWLYTSTLGHMLVPVLTRPFITHLGGAVMNSRLSKRAIPGFIRNNNIDMSQFEQREFTSYNDFFTRKILPGKRPICPDENALISPSDALLSAYPIGEDSRFQVKGTEYTLTSLLRDEEIAQHFLGGTLLLFRLTVSDYHRYCYAASGEKTADVKLAGVYHTVNPLAAAVRPLYKENTRVYSVIQTPQFGPVLQMEVGALMVGKIVNNCPGPCQAVRGEEKGRFEFGGSTVIVVLEKGAATVDPQYLENTAAGIETPVKYGQKVAVA